MKVRSATHLRGRSSKAIDRVVPASPATFSRNSGEYSDIASTFLRCLPVRIRTPEEGRRLGLPGFVLWRDSCEAISSPLMWRGQSGTDVLTGGDAEASRVAGDARGPAAG